MGRRFRHRGVNSVQERDHREGRIGSGEKRLFDRPSGAGGGRVSQASSQDVSPTRATIGLEVPNASYVQPTVRIIEVPTMRGTVPIQHSFRWYEHSVPPPNAAEPVILVAEPLPLGRYLCAELLRCLHCDQRRELVEGLATTSLTSLRIEARIVQ